MKHQIQKFDYAVLGFIKKHNTAAARFAIFIVYFWFGILKVIGSSPAQPLVQQLQQKILPFISFNNFFILFALFEMLIGLLFLIRGAERLVMVLLVAHLITTCLPLILLPQITWQGFLTPTLEGQYIIKNVLIVALAFVVAAQMEFLGEKKR